MIQVAIAVGVFGLLMMLGGAVSVLLGLSFAGPGLVLGALVEGFAALILLCVFYTGG